AQVLCATAAFADTLRGSRAHPRLGPATLSVGRIEGGTSANTVPDRCRIEIDRRVLPSEDPLTTPAELTDWLRPRLPSDVAFTCSAPWLCAPALGSEDSEHLVQLLGRAIDAVRGSHQVSAVAYGTDASTLAEAGIPAVVFGPGDIAKAHTCDEWVPL